MPRQHYSSDMIQSASILRGVAGTFFDQTGPLGLEKFSVFVEDKEVGIGVDGRIARERLLVHVLRTPIHLHGDVVPVSKLQECWMRFEVVIESVAPTAPFAADDEENVLSGPLRFDNCCVDVFRCIASRIVFLDGLILTCEQKGKQKQGVHIQHDTTKSMSCTLSAGN
jgi:hypothetical protein